MPAKQSLTHLINFQWHLTCHNALFLLPLSLCLLHESSRGHDIFYHVFSSANIDLRLLHLEHVLDSPQHTLSKQRPDLERV